MQIFEKNTGRVGGLTCLKKLGYRGIEEISSRAMDLRSFEGLSLYSRLCLRWIWEGIGGVIIV